jgi:hypothetical protein
VDFLSFARTGGRFAPHFGTDGSPTPEILATQRERLANWRTLQELAGIAPASTGPEVEGNPGSGPIGTSGPKGSGRTARG